MVFRSKPYGFWEFQLPAVVSVRVSDKVITQLAGGRAIVELGVLILVVLRNR